MDVVRQAGALLLAALVSSRGLFAQGPEDLSATLAATARDEVRVALRPVEIRYVHQEPLFLPAPRAVRALYVNAWAFGSPKLWHLVRLVEGTEINAFVVDVKDDTGCLLYPSAVPTAREIGAGACARARDAKARLDTLAVHGIYAIARIVVAKDPLLAERKPAWSVKNRETGELWRDRIDIAWVDAYNDSVWIYAAQRDAARRRARACPPAARPPQAARRAHHLRHLRPHRLGHGRPRHRPGVGGLRHRRRRRPAHGVPEPLLSWRLRLRLAERRALPRCRERPARRPRALAPARTRRRHPPVPPGLHPGSPPAALHGPRDPRADSRRPGPGHHVVGAVEPPQRVPARGVAPPRRRAGAGGVRRPLAQRRTVAAAAGASAIPGSHAVMYPAIADAATV